MHLALFVAITASLAAVAKGQEYVEECPEENGFFADAVQCDRYYECKNGQVGLNKNEFCVQVCTVEKIPIESGCFYLPSSTFT